MPDGCAATGQPGRSPLAPGGRHTWSILPSMRAERVRAPWESQETGKAEEHPDGSGGTSDEVEDARLGGGRAAPAWFRRRTVGEARVGWRRALPKWRAGWRSGAVVPR